MLEFIKDDMYSLGNILFELFFSTLPFTDRYNRDFALSREDFALLRSGNFDSMVKFLKKF